MGRWTRLALLIAGLLAVGWACAEAERRSEPAHRYSVPSEYVDRFLRGDS